MQSVANVGIGFRDHTGWAVAVAVSDKPQIHDRRRVQLCDPELPRQAYHAAAGLELDAARDLVTQVENAAATAAAREVAAILSDLASRGHQVRAVGVSVGTSRVPTDLRAILGSHPLLHAAEGELYSEALADAAQAAGLPVVRFTNKGLLAETAATMGCAPADLTDTIARLGHDLGPPWAKDQKEAALAGLLALHSVKT